MMISYPELISLITLIQARINEYRYDKNDANNKLLEERFDIKDHHAIKNCGQEKKSNTRTKNAAFSTIKAGTSKNRGCEQLKLKPRPDCCICIETGKRSICPQRLQPERIWQTWLF